MFKRANKVTALLVAAASVMSIVPAMAAQRLGTKEGTIEKAIAFDGGKYLYEGYRTDDNDKGLYYNAGDKDKQLEDAEEFVTTESAAYGETKTTVKYGTKFAMVADGGDNYSVDLSTGKISDENVQEDLMDNAKTRLRSKLTKTDRYKDLDLDDSDVFDIKKVDNGAFGEAWYQYKATTTGAAYYGFATEDGKYVDAADLANTYVYSSKNKKMVKVDEFDDLNKDAQVEVHLNDITFLTQDKGYIYAVADVNVIDQNNGAYSKNNIKFLQKISKTQGDKKDDAYIPKTVDSYLFDDTLLDNGDVHDAYTAVLKDDDGYVKAENQYRVKDNTLYVTRTKEGKVKVFKLKMTKIKENALDATVKADAGKLDAYVVKKDGDSDHDIVDKSKLDAVSIDVDGNTWALDKGVILKYDGKDWKEMYDVDRSLNTLDVYNEGSLIAYEKDGDVYTTVTEGKAQTVADAPVATPVTPAQTGWVKNADGTWILFDSIGTQLKGWANIGGSWYYLDKATGLMKTGWINDNGTWYYLAGSGAMATGWLNDNGTWYYLNASGAMLANTTVDGYRLGASGAWVR